MGSYLTGSHKPILTLAERWDGSRWRIQPTPNPTTDGISGLDSVSCPSENACTAVGRTLGKKSLTLAERWDGTKWRIESTPNPMAEGINELASVSCPSENACTAVGDYFNGVTFKKEWTLAERWDGTSWTVQPTPNPTKSSGLKSVSCPTSSACSAVGNADFPTLAERWRSG